MTKSGGKGKGRAKKNDLTGFGRALIKMHEAGDFKKMKAGKNMKSILDANALDDFIDSAELGGQDFEVARVHQNHAFLVQATTHQSIQSLDFSEFKAEQLSIPRKPLWNKNMTAEEVDRNEKHAFLTWRREIAGIENKDNYTQKVTPFEKNLEVWRQLWRVCERSDIIVQIVDGRNPLLYYTADLQKYVSEMEPTRMMMLIINKSDFLTEYQRVIWSEYLFSLGIFFVFYSAHNEQDILDHMDPNEEIIDEVEDLNAYDEIVGIAENLVNHYLGKDIVSNRSEFDIAKYISATEVESSMKNMIHEELKLNQKEIIEEEIDDEEDDDDEEEEYTDDGDDELVNPIDEEVLSNHVSKPSSDDSDDVEGQGNNDDDEDIDDDEDVDDNLMQFVQGKKKHQQEEIIDDDNNIEVEDDDDDDEEEVDNADEEETKQIKTMKDKFSSISLTATPNMNNSSSSFIQQKYARVLTRSELLLLFYTVSQKLELQPQTRHDGRICIGLVGYPNVGKSSVINTLLGVSKSTHGRVRVGVSSTPGKTKHFQTLIVTDSLMLCDCPGLVFPSFMRSTGEMLCAGILPINQMRDYQEPANVIAARIPQYLLEASLGIKIYRHLDPLDKKDRPPTPPEILSAYCQSKGYITNGTGRWDEFRACKDLLKCFTDGKILHVAIPPLNISISQQSTQIPQRNNNNHNNSNSIPSNEINLINVASSTTEEVILKRWIKETEKVMVRKLRVAERVDEQQNKIKIKTNKEDKLKTENENQFIFEYDNNIEDDADDVAQDLVKVDANGYEIIDDDSDDDLLHLNKSNNNHNSSTNTNNDHTIMKREHKRLPHWGKKNRKLRNKDPYGEDNTEGVNAYIAYSTNRMLHSITKSSTSSSAAANNQISNNKVIRNSTQHPYGTPYVRTVLPHHQVTKKEIL